MRYVALRWKDTTTRPCRGWVRWDGVAAVTAHGEQERGTMPKEIAFFEDRLVYPGCGCLRGARNSSIGSILGRISPDAFGVSFESVFALFVSHFIQILFAWLWFVVHLFLWSRVQIFDAMRRHKLGLDEANRAITVSRAMRRELLSRNDSKITPAEAIQRLIGKISLDNILYESGEDDSDEDEEGKNEIISLKIPKISRVQSSSSVKISSSSSTSTSNTTTSTNHHSSRKNTRGKKNTNPSPRNQLKANHIKLVGRKRSIEDMDSNTANGDVQTKAANGRPQLRASKRLHRSSSANNEPSVTVSSGLNANTEI